MLERRDLGWSLYKCLIPRRFSENKLTILPMKQRCENKAQKSQIRSEVVVTKDKTKHDKGMKFLLKKYSFFAFIPRDSDSNFLATSPITVPDLERHNSSRKIPVIKYFLQILSKHYHYFRFSIIFSEKNCQSRIREEDFPVGSTVKNPPANAGQAPVNVFNPPANTFNS